MQMRFPYSKMLLIEIDNQGCMMTQICQQHQLWNDQGLKNLKTCMLTFKRLHVGQLLFGVIKKVNDDELIVSLPNYFIGFVRIKDVSETFGSHQLKGNTVDLKQHYKEHEHIQCVIIGL